MEYEALLPEHGEHRMNPGHRDPNRLKYKCLSRFLKGLLIIIAMIIIWAFMGFVQEGREPESEKIVHYQTDETLT